MAGILAVVMEGSEQEMNLLESAASFSECVDADLVVLRVATKDDYEGVATTMDSIGEVTSYGDEDIRSALKKNARETARKALDGGPDEVLLRLVKDDNRADTILDVARDQASDHVFLVGKRRSPTGKALFGDVTQKVILNFDGEITLSME